MMYSIGKVHSIGVAGQARMGKDVLSNYLRVKLDQSCGINFWDRTAFAFNVKKVFSKTFDVSFDFIEEWKVKSEIPPGFNSTVREGLQQIGDGFRKIKEDIWIELRFRDQFTPQIISDVRYLNEARKIEEEQGLNILIGRSDMLNDDPNGSESQIRPFVAYALDNLETGPIENKDVPKSLQELSLFDYFIKNNDTLENLYLETDNMLVPFVLNYFDLGE